MTSWVRKYFDVNEVLVKNKKTGISALALSVVCDLPITAGDVTDVCGTHTNTTCKMKKKRFSVTS